MILKLKRETLTTRSTIGSLFVDGIWECYTLEDRVRRGPKVPGETAIPEGRYEVVITYSERFKRPLPLLLNVPNFEGIRIHSGNTEADTQGCILVGTLEGPDEVTGSRAAFAALFVKVQRASTREKVWIEIWS